MPEGGAKKLRKELPDAMGRRVVKLLNLATHLRGSRCEAGRLLILFPSCLQRSECPQKITADLSNCLRCGRCRVKDLLELAEQHGCRVAIATGGRLAVEVARGDAVDAIVAVACEKELQGGMMAALPKPTLGVINLRPHGPCKDTGVDLEEVEKAVNRFLR